MRPEVPVDPLRSTPVIPGNREMVNNLLKIVLRSLTRRKGFTFINILGLAVGMACTILFLLWVQYEWSFDKFHENADRLYRVVFTADEGSKGYWQPGPLAEELKARFPEILQATNFSAWQSKVSFERRGFFCTGSLVDSAFFEMFSFPVERGDPRTVLVNPWSIVISSSIARKMFGAGDPIGKRVQLFDQAEFVVTGVFRDIPEVSHLQFDFVIPFAAAPDFMRMWDRKCVQTYVLLQENCSLDDINRKISGVMNEHNPSWKNTLSLTPMTRSHLYNLRGGGLITYLYVFSLLAMVIMLVACINVTNLSTALAERRAKEIGIRKTMGSSRWNVAGQFLIETIASSVASLVLAVLITELLLPLLNGMLGTRIVMTFSATTITGLLVLALLTGMIAGGYPALVLSSFGPMAMLRRRSGPMSGRRSLTLRRILVIAQFGFSIFTITCVMFIRSQLSFIQSKDLGYDKENILLIRTSGELQGKCSLVKNELLKSPNVLGACVSTDNMTTLSNTGPIEWEGMPQGKVLEVAFNSVDEDFAGTFQVPITQGRFFSKEFPTDGEAAFVVNEEAVKEMNITNPLGKRLKTWMGREGRIVGVIADFHMESLRTGLDPLVLIPTSTSNFLCVRIAPGDVAATVQAVGATIKRVVPSDPFEYHFLDAEIDQQYRTEQMTGKLAGSIATVAVVLSCLGLVGLIAFAALQRTKEIGIRKVIGASVSGILIMLTRDFTYWIIIANIIAWPAAYYVMRAWLQDFAYRIDLTIWPFLAAGLGTLFIALAVVGVQALRAARANPVEALRYE